MTRRLLRALAIAIALAGAADPTVTSSRTTRPVVAVVAAAPRRDGPLAERVARGLAKEFTVISAPFADADGTIIVGDHVPLPADAPASPVFAVLPDRDGPVVTLEAVSAPARTPSAASVPVVAVARVTGARGRALDITLRLRGLVVARLARTVVTDDERIPVSLSFVPAGPGPAPLRVTATVAGARDSAAADVLIDVRDMRWAVLFFDPRPSWMSTFVRRAIERDSRFIVTSRVATSRRASTDAGQPPAALDDLAALAPFDAIIVGAPEALGTGGVAGLDAYLRRRGGGVVLLFDRRAGGAYERLTEMIAWAGRAGDRGVAIASTGTTGVTDSAALRASELAWPSTLPAGAEPVARTAPASGDSAAGQPVIWRSAVGAGLLVVSGALDAWRYRDRSASAFDEYWRGLIADVASASTPPVALALSSTLLEPGERTDVIVTLRDLALRPPPDAARPLPVRASVSAVLERAGEPGRPLASVRLWPGAGIGRFQGSVQAPAAPGAYRVVVASESDHADAPLMVTSGVTRATPDARDLLAAWVSARGGRALPASALAELPEALHHAIRATPRRETWYPMRLAWWIIPFALALSGEWWLRRRRGLT
ncbi:MAG: hypothetical protein WKG32_14915 [Gemmatimonadaceae bacterium]